MRELALYLSACLVLSACGSRSGQHPAQTERQDSTVLEILTEQNGTVLTDSTVIHAAQRAFACIPDHAKVAAEARSLMTEDLYYALTVACEVPHWEIDLGSDEFLAYFVTGQDGTVGPIKSVTATKAAEDSCTLELFYSILFDGVLSDYTDSIRLVMVNENGRWLLDDFGDGAKEQCTGFIRDEVLNWQTGKTRQYMETDSSYYSQEHIAAIERYYEEFLGRYGNYVDSLTAGGKSV